MNKLVLNAILMILTGSAFAESEKPQSAPDLRKFLDKFLNSADKQVSQFQTGLNDLLAKKGYLIGRSEVEVMRAELRKTKQNINTLRNIEDLPQTIEQELVTASQELKNISNLPVPTTFPGKCYDYDAPKQEGYVQRVLGSKTTLGFYSNQGNEEKYYNFLQSDGQYDVGLIGNGKEYTVSIALNSKVQAQLGKDANGNEVVVCMSFPAKSPMPNLSRRVQPTKNQAKEPSRPTR